MFWISILSAITRVGFLDPKNGFGRSIYDDDGGGQDVGDDDEDDDDGGVKM